MGRAPCCDKANVKRGPWSPEEDDKLKSYIQQHGTGGNWIALPQKIGLNRCGKSCRLRWLNYLRPNIRHGGFSEEEDKIICNLFMSIGSRWSIIAAQLPGRTDNDIKNYWNTKLKKKLLGKQLRKKDGKRHSKGRKIISENQDSPSSSSYINSIPHMYTFQNLPLLQTTVIPYSSIELEPRFDDHASIRKLLISLGGKFSNDNNDNHEIKDKFTNESMHNFSTGQNPLMGTINTAASTGSNNESLTVQFDHDFTNNINAAGTQDMLHGDGADFADLFEHVMYGNPQKLQDLEFLNDDDDGIVMNKTTNDDCIIPGDEETHQYPLVFQSTSLCNNERSLRELNREEFDVDNITKWYGIP